jgi:hypothetical protein
MRATGRQSCKSASVKSAQVHCSLRVPKCLLLASAQLPGAGRSRLVQRRLRRSPTLFSACSTRPYPRNPAACYVGALSLQLHPDRRWTAVSRDGCNGLAILHWHQKISALSTDRRSSRIHLRSSFASDGPPTLTVVAIGMASRSSGAETTMKTAALAAPDWPTPARAPVLCLSATTGGV